MGSPETEVDIDLFDGDGYYSVMGRINGYNLLDSIVHVIRVGEQDILITLYEHCKHIFGAKDEGGMMVYNEEIQFASMMPIGDLTDFIGDRTGLPSALRGKTLVEIIKTLYNSSTPS